MCGRESSDVHHLRFAQPRALGRKLSDEFTVPVCRLHHRELHQQGDEAGWWTGLKIDPVPVALGLWQSTHREGAFRSPTGNGMRSELEHQLRSGPVFRRSRLICGTTVATMRHLLVSIDTAVRSTDAWAGG